MINIICSTCHSTNVRRDADAVWCVETQEWKVNTVYDNGTCEDCGGEATLEEVPYFKYRGFAFSVIDEKALPEEYDGKPWAEEAYAAWKGFVQRRLENLFTDLSYVDEEVNRDDLGESPDY